MVRTYSGGTQTSLYAVNTTPAQAIADIQQTKANFFFTVFVALKGYHQCPLEVLAGTIWNLIY